MISMEMCVGDMPEGMDIVDQGIVFIRFLIDVQETVVEGEDS